MATKKKKQPRTTTTVFKLFSRDRQGNLCSWSPPNGCRQIYYANRINKPLIRNSYIFVFETASAAHQFDKFSDESRVVFECEATGVNRRRKTRLNIDEGLAAVKEFWSGKPDREAIRPLACGVIMCKTLRLIRPVDLV